MMDNKQLFLLEEYKNAAQLTFHVDELRNKLISFFLTFLGVILASIIAYFKGELPQNGEFLIGFLLVIGWVLGLIIVYVLAKLRRAQLEHFRIINNIRTYFFKQDYRLWNIIQLSSQTLPPPSWKSGSFQWVFAVILINSLLLPLATHLLFGDVTYSPKVWNFWLFIFFLSSIIFSIQIYFLFARPPDERKYSEENTPFKQI